MTIRTVAGLVDAGFAEASDALDRIAASYAIAITPHIAEVIARSGRDGGVGRQFIPSTDEAITVAGQTADPIADKVHEKVPGLIHRYTDRVLLKVIHACPVYCRFCFRREMVGPQGEAMTGADMEHAYDYIRAHPEIFEVIPTGGDPFMLPPKRITEITSALSAIPHVRVLRWHTRVPTVDPSRVTDAFVRALTNGTKTVFVGIHANHADEFTAEARFAIARLADVGVALVGQSVLLRGVNDDIDTLEALMRAFVVNRIKPYYLHQMDPAPGTAHFVVPVSVGQNLINQLRDRMTGLGIPAYVVDGPDGRKRHADSCEA